MRLVLTILAGLMVAAGAAAANEETVTARAQVINGSMLRLDGHAIRLWGIAVPPPNRQDGMRATIELFRLVDGKIVSCHLTEGRDGPAFWGKCEAAGMDLAALMVDGGVARDCTAQSNARYRIQEQRALAKGSEISRTLDLPASCERRGRKG